MKVNGVSFLKFILYILGKLICFVGCIYILWFCIMTAKNTVNANFIIKDFFSKSTSIILSDEIKEEDTALLKKICTQRCYEDIEKNFGNNSEYSISSYHNNVEAPYSLVLPWTKVRTYEVSNGIKDIVINYKDSHSRHYSEPFFPAGTYTVDVIRDREGNWMVSSCTLIEPEAVEYDLPAQEEEILDD